MSETILYLPSIIRESIWDHLLRSESDDEEVAFVFADWEQGSGRVEFHPLEWYAVPPEKFEWRSPYYVQLTDDMRGFVIKKAHDLDACIIELHSHTGNLPAQFSVSDLSGFREWVPHVLWRLDGRPYVAVVVAEGSFDGIVWLDGAESPERLNFVVTDQNKKLLPTHLSRLKMDDHER